MLKYRPSQVAGFTVVEMIVIVVVIAILAGITVIAYNNVQDKADDAKRKEDIDKIAKGLQLWAIKGRQSLADFPNSGWGSVPAAGWYDGAYGGPTVQQVLIDAGYVDSLVDDPDGYRYMISACTTAADGRRVVYARFAIPPSPTAEEVTEAAGCNATTRNQAVGSYQMNYAVVVDS